ncbi:MAG: archease [Thaumarchaeota archaeon]|nr:archease [Nitrososphaerota archaeon]MBI3022853.1 archease [Nitrososphaerota archaeon]
MPYRFLSNVAIADIAYEVRSRDVGGIFEGAAIALTEVMVDRRTIRPRLKRDVRVTAEDIDRLLYDFLTEIIILKDADSLLFKEFDVSVEGEKNLHCTLKGELIDRSRHRLRNDVKAVTMHMFGVKKAKKGLKATVVLDI